MTTSTFLRAEGLAKHFPVRGTMGGGGRLVRAVDGVDLEVARGETVALVGESGSGKTTVGRLLLGLERPTAGRVLLEGRDVFALPPVELRRLRRRMQLVFQDPASALSPRMTVGRLVAEPLIVHGLAGRSERPARVAALLENVGLSPALAARYPHELSGGQRQRVAIARALASGPDLLVGDEPVAALDVSVRAQIVNLLQDLRARLGLTLVLISHDLGVVRHMADRILVMYLGRIVESAGAATLFQRPAHPYTRALLAAIPGPRSSADERRELLEGDPPSPIGTMPGCSFAGRCPFALPRCTTEPPRLTPLGGGHEAACHRAAEVMALPTAARFGQPAAPTVERRLAVLAAAGTDG